MAVRKNVRVAARESMQKYNYDPLEVLVLFAQDAATSPASKLSIAETLLPYMYPKLSNVTLEGEVIVARDAESQAALLHKILQDPELADAAQRLSIAAAMSTLDVNQEESGLVN